MLSLKDRLLGSFMLVFVLLFVCFNERNKIDRALSNEHNLSIFNFSVSEIWLHNATLPNAHRVVEIVTTDCNTSLALCLKSNDCVVLESGVEVHMIGISSMRQICCLFKRVVPLSFLN